jgi:hydroxyethylthiazole kinase-like uncharacterized protein yjeF
VVTPHDREFTRLAGSTVGPDRVAAARDLAAQLGVVVLLKGDRTVVADPEGPVWVNPTGTPALATAGTGDVLAGLLGSLLAGGVPAPRAALAAAYVHGLTALDLTASGLTGSGLTGEIRTETFDSHRSVGSWAPVTAPDVAAALPRVIAGLLGTI